MDFWNQFIKKLHRDAKEPKEIVVELTNHLQKPSLVLDIGCGRGRHLSYLSDHGCIIIATDFSFTALQHCSTQLRRDKKKIFFVNNDVAQLCFRRESFDAVIATNSLHYNTLNKIRKSIREIHAVLKPYGWLAASFASSSMLYRNGLEIEKNTFIREAQGTSVIQHFFDEQEIKSLFGRFTIVKMYETRDDSREETEGHWYVLAQKR